MEEYLFVSSMSIIALWVGSLAGSVYYTFAFIFAPLLGEYSPFTTVDKVVHVVLAMVFGTVVIAGVPYMQTAVEMAKNF